MRKVILAMQVSLDGFIEGPNGEMDWITFDDEEQWQGIFDVLKTADTLLLGRVMYPGYEKYWSNVLADPTSYSNNDVKYARLAVETQHIVFSKTMTNADWKNTMIYKGDIKEEILNLKKQPGKDMVLLGGAKLAQSFLNLGLIDECRLVLNPVILGSGKQLFKDIAHRTDLKLLHANALNSGVVELKYIKMEKS